MHIGNVKAIGFIRQQSTPKSTVFHISFMVDGIVVANLSSAQPGVATPYMVAKFACDGIQSAATHTVVVTVLTGPVTVYGIVTV